MKIGSDNSNSISNKKGGPEHENDVRGGGHTSDIEPHTSSYNKAFSQEQGVRKITDYRYSDITLKLPAELMRLPMVFISDSNLIYVVWHIHNVLSTSQQPLHITPHMLTAAQYTANQYTQRTLDVDPETPSIAPTEPQN